MTLFEVEELTRYWTEHPPLHLTLAAYLGFGRERRRPATPWRASAGTETTSTSNAGTLLAELGPGFATGDVHAGLAPVVLDMTQLRCRPEATG
jgi:hypothetical protein